MSSTHAAALQSGPVLPRQNFLCLAILSALALASGIAQAQAVEPAKDRVATTVYLSPLVNQADEKDPYVEPASTSAISRDAIGLFGGQNLDDVLRSTPGTFTRDSPQNPGIAVNIRGVEGSGRVNMMIDGVRQSFRFTGHEAQGFTYVDPALLAGIDVRRGATSGAGGAGTLAGTANFRTLGVDDVLREGRDVDGFLTLSAGSNGSQFAPSGAAAFRIGDWGIVGAISQRSPGDYRNGADEKVRYTGQDLASGLLKIEYAPGDAHRLTVGGVFYDNDFVANSYTQNIDSTQLSANYAYSPGGDLIDLRVNAYRSEVTMTYGTSPLIATGGTAAGRKIDDVGTGFDISNTSRFGSNVTTTYGIEYFHDDVDVRNSTTVPGRGVNPSGESTIASAFSTTTLGFGIVDTIIGLRYDRYQLEGSGSVTASNPLGMPAGAYVVDREEGKLLPKLTVVINVTDWFQPYASVSKSFRPPTISEAMAGGDHPANGGPPQSFFPNPTIESETSKGWEAGANFRGDALFTRDDSYRLKLNYFDNRIDDYITAMFSPTGGVYFGNNAGTSKVKGVELEGGYDAGFVFANLGYSDTDSKLPSQINGFGAQSYMPDTVLSATLGARFFERRFTLGTRYYKVSESSVGEINVASGVDPHDPGYELVDVFANYAFDNGTEISANVANALDEEFTPALSTPAGGNSIDTGRGRTYMLTAKLRF